MPRDRGGNILPNAREDPMNPITECKRCSDCAIRLGFGFTQPDVLI